MDLSIILNIIGAILIMIGLTKNIGKLIGVGLLIFLISVAVRPDTKKSNIGHCYTEYDTHASNRTVCE